jgi:hypothetical protein
MSEKAEKIMTIKMMTCRVCGCSQYHACRHSDGTPCHWAEADLCSVCAETYDPLLDQRSPERPLEAAFYDDCSMELITYHDGAEKRSVQIKCEEMTTVIVWCLRGLGFDQIAAEENLDLIMRELI